MGRLDYAKCPNCRKVANGTAQVELLFGYRINEGIKMVQSWCKECR